MSQIALTAQALIDSEDFFYQEREKIPFEMVISRLSEQGTVVELLSSAAFDTTKCFMYAAVFLAADPSFYASLPDYSQSEFAKRLRASLAIEGLEQPVKDELVRIKELLKVEDDVLTSPEAEAPSEETKNSDMNN